MNARSISRGARRTLTSGLHSVPAERAVTVVDLSDGSAWARLQPATRTIGDLTFEALTLDGWSAQPQAPVPTFAVVDIDDVRASGPRRGWAGSAASLPLVAVGEVTPDRALAEQMRRQGVLAYLETRGAIETVQATLGRLAAAEHWFQSPLKHFPPADLLQMIGERGSSVQVVVGCPHAGPLLDQRFEDGPGRCSGRDDCTGWIARLVFKAGRLHFAETHRARGLEALAECIQREVGWARVHEMLLHPIEPNLEGSLQHLIINAAQIGDEQRRDASRAPKPIPPQPPGPRPTTPSASRTGPPPLPTVPRPSNQGDSTMTRQMLGGRASIRLAVQVTPDGQLLDKAGEGDAESVAATAAMCDSAVAEAGEMLGLGMLEGWVSLSDGMSLYCVQGKSGLIGCIGGPSRTALAHLAHVVAAGNKGDA